MAADIFKLVGSVFVDTAEANKSLSKTGDKADETSNKFADFAKGAGKVATAIGAAAIAVGTAVVSVAKESISSYADYEQALGGVETLFGESAGKVIANAEQAYKNAGVSATEYMETVTGFSAALLQSLGDDTDKAADVANIALVDMSDNAAKFGTDISSIQNAYQGFAKQNYTMLDNLKLGYGGTKSEMERLLATANEINAEQGIITDYQLENYADIIEAIHVVQTEIGITGTTQEEAGTTISGTLNMIQKKFDDMKTNLGASLAPAIQSVLNMVAENLPKIESVIEQLVPFISELCANLLPVIVDLFDQFLPSLIEIAESIMPLISELFVGEFVPVFTEIVHSVMPVLVTLIDALAPFVIQLAQKLLPVIVPLLNTALQILQPLLQLLQPILDIAMAILDPLIKLINIVLKPIIDIIQFKLTFAISLIQPILEKLTGWFTAAFGFISKIVTDLGNTFSKLWEGLKVGFKTGLNACIKFLNGMINGLNAFLTPLRKVIQAVGNVFGANWSMDQVAIPQIPYLAKGGRIDEGGSAVVGEAGAELISMPKGATVTPLTNNGDVLPGISELNEKLNRLIDLVANVSDMGVYINGNALVGKIAPAMDKQLGRLTTNANRRV